MMKRADKLNFSRAGFSSGVQTGRVYDSDGKSSLGSNFENLPEWNLDDLYPGMESSEFVDDLELCQKEAKEFQLNYSDRLETLLADDCDKLGEVIKRYENISERMGRIMSYAALIYTGNNTDPARMKFYGDAQEKITTAASSMLFFTLEINRLDEQALNSAMDDNETLGYYRPWIEDTRRDKPYQLDDEIEQLFLEKSVTGSSAFNRLFDETMASLRFNINDEELAIEPSLNLLQHKDRELRQTAAREIGSVLSQKAGIFTLITNTLAKDLEISNRWRGFDDVAASRHHNNRVEGQVVDALADAVQNSFGELSHRYFKMKAKWLGLETMEYWDRNAPLPMSPEQVYQWDDARQIVLDAYGGFSPQMAEIAKRFFDRSWIDAPVRDGKSPGAFAHPTVPSVHPYVMLNYLGKPRDVMTLAHELGHGVHQVLAAEQGALMSQTPLTLAETASVFGEMLTFRSLLAACKDVGERKALLAQKVEDMLNTVVRQIAFYLFERRVHERRKNGELTTQDIGKIWMEVQEESLGSAFNFEDSYQSYWSYIPHFIHSPFYVYAYAFGDCLVNSLYAVYEENSEGFQDKYFDLLKAGGTQHYSQLLEPFGLDAGDPEFWYRGLSMISQMIDELEKMEVSG